MGSCNIHFAWSFSCMTPGGTFRTYAYGSGGLPAIRITGADGLPVELLDFGLE